MEMYEVGGCVRDRLLGDPNPKDIDFSIVLDEGDLSHTIPANWGPFEVMEMLLRYEGFELFDKARKPEHLTARGRFPKDHPVYPSMAADFVLARKEGGYSDGRRPDFVDIGTLYDDLARRDLTMNAIAMDAEGILIDPFGGAEDIRRGLIRAVGNPLDRFTEDALRAVRALRFSVTKYWTPFYKDIQGTPTTFFIDPAVRFAMENATVLNMIENSISDERIKDELSKMFRFDTLTSIKRLNEFPLLTEAMLSGNVSLDATLKTKGRGK